MNRKRFVQVGTGGRATMYISALYGEYKDVGELVALCDLNPKRMEYWNDKIVNEYGGKALPAYLAKDFDRMIEEMKPDTVIVTSVDRTHHKYICRAMELGCDVISEKPMTIDAEKCQAIIDTQKRTGKKLTVTFNYRYQPRADKVKEVIQSGAIGDVTSIHFEWLLDTCHGADYFRRWHRNKANSGGLLVHKATHHFDLVNWWISSRPVTVFAMGDLKFYGKENAEARGITEFYDRSRTYKNAINDPFALYVTGDNKIQMGLYYNAESADGYYRDRSVFSDGIDIEDNMSVMVRYANKAVMTYSLNAHSPWEGYRVCFNGTKGRLELQVVETEWCRGRESFNAFGVREQPEVKSKKETLTLRLHWSPPEEIEIPKGDGAHGGGDKRLLNDIFRGADPNDKLCHAAGYEDGANSILTGIAGNLSIKTGLPVNVESLVKF